jgi:hypothetical protein
MRRGTKVPNYAKSNTEIQGNADWMASVCPAGMVGYDRRPAEGELGSSIKDRILDVTATGYILRALVSLRLPSDENCNLP